MLPLVTHFGPSNCSLRVSLLQDNKLKDCCAMTCRERVSFSFKQSHALHGLLRASQLPSWVTLGLSSEVAATECPSSLTCSGALGEPALIISCLINYHKLSRLPAAETTLDLELQTFSQSLYFLLFLLNFHRLSCSLLFLHQASKHICMMLLFPAGHHELYRRRLPVVCAPCLPKRHQTLRVADFACLLEARSAQAPSKGAMI